MATLTLQEAEQEDLTDQQIDQLLKQAGDRLRNTSKGALVSATTGPTSTLSSRRLGIAGLPRPYVESNGDVAKADARRLVEDSTRTMANGIRKVEDPLVVKKQKLEAKKATAGASWYNLPKTNLTPELKRDLDLLKMRSVLDPKRFYKKDNTKSKPPEFSQIGTVIEGPTDYFSGRIPKKQRKRTLAEELIENEKADGRFKRQYDEVQTKKTSGKRGDYTKRMQKRYGRNYKK